MERDVCMHLLRISMYVLCTCLYTYTYMCIHMHAYIYIYVFIYIYIQVDCKTRGYMFNFPKTSAAFPIFRPIQDQEKTLVRWPS